MKNCILKSGQAALLAMLTTLTLATTAQAQASRTWVSGVGDDVNPCSRTAPCKTFAGAISRTAAGGEISALDPAGFGSVVITKSITISGDGTLAGILNASTSGVIVNAAGIVVVLRNLSLSAVAPTQPGTYGVRIIAAANVVIENVTIEGNRGTPGVGVSVNTAADTKVLLRNVGIRNSDTGVLVTTTAGTAQVMMERVSIQNTDTAVSVDSGATVEINGSSINFNGVGVTATTATSTVRLSDSTISMNTTGLSTAAGGQIISYNNNRLRGNTTDGAPTSTVYQR